MRKLSLCFFGVALIVILAGSCMAPKRSYYPQTQTYKGEGMTINKTFSLKEVRIVGFNNKGRARTINLIQDQEDELANNIRKGIVDNFHRNRLFALTFENDTTADIVSSVEIHDLKLLTKTNTFGKIWLYSALPVYAYGLGAGATVAKKHDGYGSLSNADKVLLFSSVGSLLWVTTPLFFNIGSVEISFTLLLENYDRASGQLVGIYRTEYGFKQKYKERDSKQSIIADIDDAFDESLQVLRQQIRQDVELYSEL